MFLASVGVQREARAAVLGGAEAPLGVVELLGKPGWFCQPG